VTPPLIWFGCGAVFALIFLLLIGVSDHH